MLGVFRAVVVDVALPGGICASGSSRHSSFPHVLFVKSADIFTVLGFLKLLCHILDPSVSFALVLGEQTARSIPTHAEQPEEDEFFSRWGFYPPGVLRPPFSDYCADSHPNMVLFRDVCHPAR